MRNSQLNDDYYNYGQSHIIIGANGSGKSSILRDMAEKYLVDRIRVIAIAPSLYDKFGGIKNPKFSFLGARQGRNLVKKSLLKIFRDVASKDDMVMFKSINRILEYLGFDGTIGLRINVRNNTKRDVLSAVRSFKENEEIGSMLLKWISQHREDEIAWLSMNEYSFREIDQFAFSKVSKYENQLKKMGVIESTEYFLRRKGKAVPLMDASSGELTLLASILAIAANIEPDSVILIDEPETSLHPKWQREYFSQLMDLFYYWNPRLVIATHSPMVVAGVEADKNKSSVRIHRLDSDHSYEEVVSTESIEEMMWRKFNTLTPKSNYLSELTINLLNQLASGEISLEKFNNEMKLYVESSYDEKQEKALNDLIEFGHQIVQQQQQKR